METEFQMLLLALGKEEKAKKTQLCFPKTSVKTENHSLPWD